MLLPKYITSIHFFGLELFLGILIYTIVIADVQGVETVLKVYGNDTKVQLQCPLSLDGTKIEWGYVEMNADGTQEVKKILGYNSVRNKFSPSGYNKIKYSLIEDTNGNFTVFVIRELTLSDSKPYKCEIKGGSTTLSYDVIVEVIVPPKNDGVALSIDDHFVENEPSPIQCHISNILPGKNKTKFVIFVASVEQKNLQGSVTEVQNEHNGTYTVTYSANLTVTRDSKDKNIRCRVVWMKGTNYTRKVYKVEKNINVYYKPTTVTATIDADGPVPENTEVKIGCNADANPPPNFSIINKIDDQENTVSDTVPWSVKLSKEYNKKEFYCVANGTTPDLQYRILSDPVQTVVLYPPEVSVVSTNPDEEYFVEGYDLSLTCNTTGGNPKNNISSYRWEFKPKYSTEDSVNYRPLDSSVGQVKSEGKDLVITDLSSQAAGSYRCTVNTMGGQSSGEKNVTVYLPPKHNEVTFSIQDHFVENVPSPIQCNISNILPGKEKTRFVVNVAGDVQENLQESTTEIQNEADGTYTVTYSDHLTVTKDSNNKNIKCKVVWMERTEYSKKVEKVVKNINVYYKPTAVNLTIDADGPVQENTNITIGCNADANPSPDLSITNETIDYPENIVSATVPWVVSLSRQYNNKTFYCVADGSTPDLQYHELSNQAITEVLFKATSIDMIMKPTELIDDGNDGTFVCETDEGNPAPSIEWRVVGGELINENRGHNILGLYKAYKRSSTLISELSKEMNGKELECSVTDPPTRKATTTLRVSFRPNGNTMDPIQSVKVFDMTTVQCRANSANPVSDVGMKFYIGETEVKYFNSTNEATINGNYNGKIAMFTYRFTSTQSDHGKKIKCRVFWEGNDVGHERKKKLDFYYPPEVSVVSTNPDETYFVEGYDLSLTCNTTGGNYQNKISSYSWEFKPKYDTKDSGDYRKLESEERDLVISNISYQAAGSYRCTVNTPGGQSSGVKNATVYYSAIQLSGEKLVYAALNNVSTIQFKFRLLPFGKTNMNVKWQKQNTIGIQDIPPINITTEQIDGGIWTTTYNMNVHQYSFGNYSVTITNNKTEKRLKPVIFKTELKNQGPPQRPRDVTVTAESPTTLLVTWKVGLDGGYVQTFIIEYKEQGKGDFVEVAREIPTHKSVGEIQEYRIMNLKPDCEYDIRVSAISEYDSIQVSAISSGKTQAKPSSLGLIIGIVFGIIVIPLVVFIVVVFILNVIQYRRTKPRKGTPINRDRNGSTYNRGPTISGQPLEMYAVVDKTKKTPKQEPSEMYAVVDKSKKTPKPEQSETYSVVDKSKKNLKPVIAVKPMKYESGLSTKASKDQRGVYENVPLGPVSNDKVDYDSDGDENLYMNVDRKQPLLQAPVRPDEQHNNNTPEAKLIYADVAFDHMKPKEGVNPPLDGQEPVTYATVDFSKTPSNTTQC